MDRLPNSEYRTVLSVTPKDWTVYLSSQVLSTLYTSTKVSSNVKKVISFLWLWNRLSLHILECWQPLSLAACNGVMMYWLYKLLKKKEKGCCFGCIVCNIYFFHLLILTLQCGASGILVLHVLFATSCYGLGFKILCVEGLIKTWFLWMMCI